MITTEKEVLTVETTVQAPVEKVWNLWTDPKHIMQWNNASDDWFTPSAENDLRAGGKFLSRMEARDGSYGFDFWGVYSKVEPYKRIEYTLGDDRKVRVSFESKGNGTVITENFEAEQTNSVELQQNGWQAILNNFKKHVETSDRFENMHFEVSINASAEKIYHALTDEKLWSEWAAAFNPTSHFIGSWEKGSSIRFLGTDEDGSTGGMVSRIRENIPNKFISIEHLGMIEKGKEITTGSEVESWAGAMEKYFLKEENGKTLLYIDIDSNQNFKDYFENTWPKALELLKEISER